MVADQLFRQDSYLKSCRATVTAVDHEGVRLNRTIFYPMGGGQPGDTGIMRWQGVEAGITDTRKWRSEGAENDTLHVLGAGKPQPQPGDEIELELDWERRYALMRMHTCLHLLSAIFRDASVTGGQVGVDKSRLDFNFAAGHAPDKDFVTDELNRLISGNHNARDRWITDAELEAQLELVRTMSVKPPVGQGRVRLLEIGKSIDLQPCGGTHVRNTSEIGPVEVLKIENKGKQNRRIIIAFQAQGA